MTTNNPIPTQPETLEKEFDEPHRWEVEPHPWDSDYDIFVTDDDEAAREAILHAAEMHLWDSNDGEERTLRVKMNDKIANVANSRRAAVTAPRGDAWRPIESAPRNGAAILVGHERHGSRLVRWMISMAKDAPNGWWFIDGYDGPRLMWEPTHWMFAPALGDKTT